MHMLEENPPPPCPASRGEGGQDRTLISEHWGPHKLYADKPRLPPVYTVFDCLNFTAEFNRSGWGRGDRVGGG